MEPVCHFIPQRGRTIKFDAFWKREGEQTHTGHDAHGNNLNGNLLSTHVSDTSIHTIRTTDKALDAGQQPSAPGQHTQMSERTQNPHLLLNLLSSQCLLLHLLELDQLRSLHLLLGVEGASNGSEADSCSWIRCSNRRASHWNLPD